MTQAPLAQAIARLGAAGRVVKYGLVVVPDFSASNHRFHNTQGFMGWTLFLLVPGRPWLSFQDASYEISRVGNRTLITRKTTIISRLSPAWYWRRLEAIGVHTEHEYLFEALEKKLKAPK